MRLLPDWFEPDFPQYTPPGQGVATLPSASRIDLAIKCAFPWITDQKWPYDPPTKYSARGNAIHKVAENIVNGTPYSMEDIANEYKVPGELGWLRIAETNVVEYLRRNPFDECAVEVVTFYNPLTGAVRRGKDRRERKYGEMTIIIDQVRTKDGVTTVADYKSGKVSPVHATDNAQMRVGALVASKLFDLDRVFVELVYIGTGLYVNGGINDGGEIDGFELDLIEMGIRKLVTELPTRAEPTGGSWCNDSYCPLRNTCAENPKNKKKARKVA